jgi:rRNA-processing protein Efg1
MPRPPSKHGLEKKFKSWRRGKSKNASTSSSLKHQLRGHERLLSKVEESDTERRTAIMEKIQQVKAEIDSKQRIEMERKNATASHGVRFLERTRLVRMEKQIKSSSNDERELFKIALDQVYVAHFPKDIKYLPLFKKGNERSIDEGKALFRRAVTRNRIFKELSSYPRVNWISEEQYSRLPNAWSIQLEQEVFGGRKKSDTDKHSALVSDDRFTFNQDHNRLLDEAEKLESSLEPISDPHRCASKRSRTYENESGYEKVKRCDKVDDFNISRHETNLKDVANQSESRECDAESFNDDSESSSSSEEDSDDTSVSISDEGDQSSKEVTHQPFNSSSRENTDEADDDFLTSVFDGNAFEKAKVESASELVNRGDKSKGWTTQRQRPGQFKKKRQRS